MRVSPPDHYSPDEKRTPNAHPWQGVLRLMFFMFATITLVNLSCFGCLSLLITNSQTSKTKNNSQKILKIKQNSKYSKNWLSLILPANTVHPSVYL